MNVETLFNRVYLLFGRIVMVRKEVQGRSGLKSNYGNLYQYGYP